jgi:hypothetical protein
MQLLFDKLLYLAGTIRQFQDCRVGAPREFADIQRVAGGQNRIDSIYQYAVNGIYFQAINGNKIVPG